MFDIFISYSSKDRKRVASLVASLTALHGWSIWWDERVQTGARFTSEIETALAESRCVLVVWSADSVESDWVRSEADQGRKRGILVPICLDQAQPPMPFEMTETTDFSNWNGSEQESGFLGLVEAIQRILATGAAAGTEELIARELRQRTVRRRKKYKMLAYLFSCVMLVTAAIVGFQLYTENESAIRESNRLAMESEKFRELALARNEEELTTSWWYLLFDTSRFERITNLETSTLLAIEGLRHAPTASADRALQEVWAVWPFSNWALTEDDNWLDGSAIDFNHNGQLLAIGGSSNGTLVWDFRNEKILAQIKHAEISEKGWQDRFGARYKKRGSRVIDFSPIEDLLATAGLDGTLKLWDAMSGQQMQSLEHAEAIVNIQFSPDGQLLASASYDGTARLWNSHSGAEIARLDHDDVVDWVEFSPSGKYLASASRSGKVHVWSTDSGKQLAVFDVKPRAEGVGFGPDDKILAVFGDEIETSLWEWEKGTLFWSLPAYSNGDAGVVFSPDGKQIVVGETSGYLSWWDLDKKTPLFSKKAGAYIISMDASSEGSRIVTHDTNDLVQVWDSNTGRELKRMPYARWTTSAALSPDGETMASGGEEWGRDYLYIFEATTISPENPIAAACGMLSGNLTRNQWYEHFADAPYRLTCPLLGESEEL
jgi:WD40 repeat protein